MAERACKNCIYWKYDRDVLIGKEWRRSGECCWDMPPVVRAIFNSPAVRDHIGRDDLTMYDDESCGEFKPRPATPTPQAEKGGG